MIGDLTLDETISGALKGIASTAPVPIVERTGQWTQPGAAARTALLLRQFGPELVLLGWVGDDDAGYTLMGHLERHGIGGRGIMIAPQRATGRQTRIRVTGAGHPPQDLLHLTAPKSAPPDREVIVRHLRNHVSDCSAVVLVDATGATIDAGLVETVRREVQKNNVMLIGDSERQLTLFSRFTAVTPNMSEARFALGQTLPAEQLGLALRSVLQCGALFLSRGIEGVSVFSQDGNACHVPVQGREVFDTTGAGEMVTAAVTAGLLAGWEPEPIARLANTAAGAVVTKPGLSDVTLDEIKTFNRQLEAQQSAEKSVTLEALQPILQRDRSAGRKVVWTNGCFDLMHVGHILYLEKARSYGDLLVVGLNSDASVRLSKGLRRPIVQQDQRAKLLSALSCVDYIVLFDEESPIHLIEKLRPDVYAKGGDYTIETINQNERRLVESYGGEIALFPGVEGLSTSALIEKIISKHGD